MRIAGLLVAAQGLVGVAVTIVALVRATMGAVAPSVAMVTAGWLALCAAALLALAVGLLRGRAGVRNPAVVAQLLLLGVAWYAAGPSGQPAYGVPAACVCVAILMLLFSRSTTGWIYAADAGAGDAGDVRVSRPGRQPPPSRDSR